MGNLQNRRMAVGKRFTVFTTAIFLIAIVFSFNTAAWAEGRDIGGKRDIDVATFNLYVGADFTPVLTLDPSDPAYFSKLILSVCMLSGDGARSTFSRVADPSASLTRTWRTCYQLGYPTSNWPRHSNC